MTTIATQLRDDIYQRLESLAGYEARRKTPVAQLQPNNLPCLSTFILGEQLQPDGDPNAGELKFVSTVTIGISVVRGFDDPATLSGDIDSDVDRIEDRLFTDPEFISFGPNALFESISSVNRRRLYPQNGETYFAELRLEIAFVTRVAFEPSIPDQFEDVNVTGKVVGGSPQTMPMRGRVELEQD
jgi:hypothetical protein